MRLYFTFGESLHCSSLFIITTLESRNWSRSSNEKVQTTFSKHGHEEQFKHTVEVIENVDDAIEALGAGGNETAVNFMKQGKLLLEEKVKAFCRECYFLGRSDFAFTAYRDPKHDIIFLVKKDLGFLTNCWHRSHKKSWRTKSSTRIERGVRITKSQQNHKKLKQALSVSDGSFSTKHF